MIIRWPFLAVFVSIACAALALLDASTVARASSAQSQAGWHLNVENAYSWGPISCVSIMVCDIGGSFTTTDGGAAWQPHNIPDDDGVPRSISCGSTTACEMTTFSPSAFVGPSWSFIVGVRNGGETWA